MELTHDSNSQPRKLTGPSPYATEKNWPGHRESTAALQDVTESGLGWDLGGGQTWVPTLASEGTLERAGRLMWWLLFPVRRPCILLSRENPAELFPTLGRCTRRPHPRSTLQHKQKSFKTHPASVVGRNLEKFRARGRGRGRGRLWKGFCF